MEKTQNSSAVELKERIADDKRLFVIVNPATGRKYDIPMLSRTAPDYYLKYVYFMRLKESSPSTFEAVMSWD